MDVKCSVYESIREVGDAANILLIGSFPQDPQERCSWISIIRGLQDEESGMFREPTHHEIHTTAHCIAALELFDARKNDHWQSYPVIGTLKRW